MNLNYVHLIGNLTDSLQEKVASNGKFYISFYLAINEPKAKTEYILVYIWDKYAETLKGLLTKGLKVSVSGKLKTFKTEKTISFIAADFLNPWPVYKKVEKPAEVESNLEEFLPPPYEGIDVEQYFEAGYYDDQEE